MSTQVEAQVSGPTLRIGQMEFDIEGGGFQEHGSLHPLNPHTALSELPEENPLVVTGEGVQIEFGSVISEKGTECYATVLVPFVAWARKAIENFEKAMPEGAQVADIADAGESDETIKTALPNGLIASTKCRANEYEFTFRSKNLEVWRTIEHVAQTVRDTRTKCQ